MSASTGGACTGNCDEEALCGAAFNQGCAEGGGGGGGDGGDGGSGGASTDNPDCDGDGDPNETDCHPCNGDVHSGQQTYFGVPYECFPGNSCPQAVAEQSFDFDCNGVVELQPLPPRADACERPSLGTGCDHAQIRLDSASCGGFIAVQKCRTAGLGCTEDGPPTQMQVGCR